MDRKDMVFMHFVSKCGIKAESKVESVRVADIAPWAIRNMIRVVCDKNGLDYVEEISSLPMSLQESMVTCSYDGEFRYNEYDD